MHPSIENILRFFSFEHLPAKLRDISKPFHDLAQMLANNEDLKGQELTVALRKLLESKDAAVRAAL